MKTTLIGLDLDRDNAQISYYNERVVEPETVAVSEHPECYLIPVPADMFRLIEAKMELGQTALANFLKKCISFLKPAVQPEDICIMVTMKRMDLLWADAIREACQMIGIGRENVFLQTHQESFCSYTLNQRRDLWAHSVALFEYEEKTISSYIMRIDYSTKPALVTAQPGKVLELGTQGSRSQQQWDQRRDELFRKMIEETLDREQISAVYLIGDSFDKTWAVESLRVLCHRRHVFQGRNLYTKGACYSAMQRMGKKKRLDQFLYQSDDLVTVNLSMQMEVRKKMSSYTLINAGISWFEAEHVCEFIAENTDEVEIYAKSMLGGDTEKYSIVLKGLPKREGRTVRLWLSAKFTSPNRCKITVRDLGFGEFYPPSGMVWESTLEV